MQPSQTKATDLATELVSTVPLLANLDLVVEEATPKGRVVFYLPESPASIGPFGAILGAVTMSMADLAAGTCAALSWRALGTPGPLATQEFSMYFLAPARGFVRATAEPIRISSRRAVVSVTIDDAETQVAVGHVSLRLLV
jgi:acyl-coenzyme A thioesterase PaaI-like protein